MDAARPEAASARGPRLTKEIVSSAQRAGTKCLETVIASVQISLCALIGNCPGAIDAALVLRDQPG
ncbi:hypothetical protein D3C85_1398060 [compost metagenome]|jgi:hypothetical protein